ncbi:PAAR domain-containing protein [Neisseriaceae bacterium CLB008]
MPSFRYLMRAHDGSNHDGTIIPQPNRTLIAGQAQALVGDPVFCPRCNGVFPIVGWHANPPLSKGMPAAEGMVTACGAILQASQKQQSLSVDFLALAHELIDVFALAPSQASAFEDPQYPASTQQHPFAKTILIRQLRARLRRHLDLPNLASPSIQQGPSSLCGPACFAFCLLQDRPDHYVATILSLWQHGQAQLGQQRLQPRPTTLRPKNFTRADSHGQRTHLPIIDWIFLASLKDSSNKLLPYATPHHKTAGITFWFHLDRWFHAVGAPKLNHYYAPLGSHSRQIAQLNQQHPDHHLIALVGAGLLHNGHGRLSNHWIVLTKPPVYAQQPPLADTHTRLQLFSWGQCSEQGRLNLTFKSFKQHLYGVWSYGQIP